MEAPLHSSPASGLADRESTEPPSAEQVVQAVRDMLMRSSFESEALPEALRQVAGMEELHALLWGIRHMVCALSRGDLHHLCRQKGFVVGALKALQSDLRHLTWQVQCVAKGEYQHRVNFMGDFSTAFNMMVEELDKNVSELMKTVGSIVNSSLVYNDIFNVVLLKLRFSFYGIITLGVDIDLVGQVGVLATFGVEIEVKSGERIGFEYKFLKFEGSSYTQKLESSVTSSVYLIGKVGARVGIRVTISITLCGFISTSIEGSVYAYAELSGFYYNTANLVSGASTELGALKFEVGIDVVVKLQLKVKLIFKTKKKSWTVYSGRWPLWSKSYSSGFSYMNQTTLADMWKVVSKNADQKDSFGFSSIPMKNWDMAKGTCKESFVLATQKDAGISLQIQNLKVDGKAVSDKDPWQNSFM